MYQDDQDLEHDFMPYSSWVTVDGYLVGIIRHVVQYTRPLYRDTGISELAICITLPATADTIRGVDEGLLLTCRQ